VNQQPLDVTLVEHDDELCTHISGTDFYQPIEDESFLALQNISKLDIASETDDIYRSEYLAYLILHSAINLSDDFDTEALLHARKSSGELLSLVQRFASPGYKEGYIKGIHDHDAEKILNQLLPSF
jgi:hypothetical protein